MANSYDDLRLEKGMYGVAGKSFTQVLEEADPSENYRGTGLEGLDAFQRQLKRFDIKVRGTGSDCVEKFFQTADSSVLFPEYISRCVRQGMEQEDVLTKLCATVTQIDGQDYRSLSADTDEDEKTLKHVMEGAEIPVTTIKTGGSLVRLNKRGRMLVASYEAVRFQKLDLFSITLRQIGSSIMKSHLADAVDVIVNGDGNDNVAVNYAIGTDPIEGTAGTLSYEALVDFWAQFEPYEMNTLLVGSGVLPALLRLPAFRDAHAGFTFQADGKLVTPMGAEILRAPTVADGTILGLDRNYALEMVRSGDVTVEYDKLIDRQLERAAITSISGFAKIYRDASAVLTI